MTLWGSRLTRGGDRSKPRTSPGTRKQLPSCPQIQRFLYGASTAALDLARTWDKDLPQTVELRELELLLVKRIRMLDGFTFGRGACLFHSRPEA